MFEQQPLSQFKGPSQYTKPVYLLVECMVLPDTDILEGLIFELDPVDNSVKLLELKQCKIFHSSRSQKKELTKLYDNLKQRILVHDISIVVKYHIVQPFVVLKVVFSPLLN